MSFQVQHFRHISNTQYPSEEIFAPNETRFTFRVFEGKYFITKENNGIEASSEEENLEQEKILEICGVLSRKFNIHPEVFNRGSFNYEKLQIIVFEPSCMNHCMQFEIERIEVRISACVKFAIRRFVDSFYPENSNSKPYLTICVEFLQLKSVRPGAYYFCMNQIYSTIHRIRQFIRKISIFAS